MSAIAAAISDWIAALPTPPQPHQQPILSCDLPSRVIPAALLAFDTIELALMLQQGGEIAPHPDATANLFTTLADHSNELRPAWFNALLGEESAILIVMQWHSDASDNATLHLEWQQQPGEGVPLLWRHYRASELKAHRLHYEAALLGELKALLPPSCHLTIVVDTPLCDTAQLKMIRNQIGLDYLVRCKGNLLIKAEHGAAQSGTQWLGRDQGLRQLRRVAITSSAFPVALLTLARNATTRAIEAILSSETTLSAQQMLHPFSHPNPGGDWLTATPDHSDRDRLAITAALQILLELGSAGEEIGLEAIKPRHHASRNQNRLQQGLALRHHLAAIAPAWRQRLLLRLYDRLAALRLPLFPAITAG
jgi:hypothetical protein